MKRVIQIDHKGDIVAVYDSISAASIATRVPEGAIDRCLRGVQSIANGTRWKWEITAGELRRARIKDRKERQAQKQKELEKWFK